MKCLIGKEALRAYWIDHIRHYPASGLDNRKPSHGGAAISYVTSSGIIGAVLGFDSARKILTEDCGPAR